MTQEIQIQIQRQIYLYIYRQILLYCSSKRTMTNLIKFQPNSRYKHRYKRTRIFPHQVLEATIPYMYELNMDNQENEGAAERELRLLIHQSIVGGVSFFIIRSSSYHPHHDDDPHHIMYCHHKNLWVSFFVRTSSSYRENSYLTLSSCYRQIILILFRSSGRAVSGSRRSKIITPHVIIIIIL